MDNRGYAYGPPCAQISVFAILQFTSCHVVIDAHTNVPRISKVDIRSICQVRIHWNEVGILNYGWSQHCFWRRLVHCKVSPKIMHDTWTYNRCTGTLSLRPTCWTGLYKGNQHVPQEKMTDLSQDLLQEETAKMHWRNRAPTKHVQLLRFGR